MELPRREAREAKGLEQWVIAPGELLGDQLADADHLIAVIRIGDDENIVAKAVEHREAVEV